MGDEAKIEKFLVEPAKTSKGRKTRSYADIVVGEWGACQIDMTVDNKAFKLSQCK